MLIDADEKSNALSNPTERHNMDASFIVIPSLQTVPQLESMVGRTWTRPLEGVVDDEGFLGSTTIRVVIEGAIAEEALFVREEMLSWLLSV